MALTETVGGLIDRKLAEGADRPALIYGGKCLSYRQLDDLSRRAAAGLAALGVGPGDRVALWLPNTPAYLALYLACARLGAIAAAVNTRFRAVEVADIVSRSGARVLALWPGFRQIDFLSILAEIDPAALDALEALVLYDEGGTAAALPGALADKRRVPFRDLVAQAPMSGDAGLPEQGLSTFTTSGTTRAPKFVLHAQRSIAVHAQQVAEGFGYRAGGGAMLVALPLCGVFGLSQAMAGLAAGTPLVLTSAFDAGEAVELIARHDVRHVNATDDMILAMLQASPHEIALPSVGSCGYAAFNPGIEDIVGQADRRGLRLVGLYGMSEVQALFARRDPADPPAVRGVNGGTLISPQAEARVRDPESGRLLPPGGQGELELKGPSLMTGYFGNPEATAEALTEDGFVRTGDLAAMQDARSFTYLARMGDVLRLGGFLVSPSEIEAHLETHPAVRGAQVVGVQTGKGLRAVAFVTPAGGGGPLDEQALIGHCAAGLARFKVPARVLPVAEFPTTKSANGTKIQKSRLREMAIEALRREAAA